MTKRPRGEYGQTYLPRPTPTTRPDYHTKTAKLVRATDEQWAAWQRAANKLTGGNLNAFMVYAADEAPAVLYEPKKKSTRAK